MLRFRHEAKIVLLLILFSAVTTAIGEQIESIQTAGNRTISRTKIMSKVYSRSGQQFDSKIAADDAKRIAELPGVQFSYYSVDTIDGKIKLTFVVIERNLIRSVEFVGNRKYKDVTLRKKANLKIGEYLDPVLTEQAPKLLEDYYRKKGFAFATVTADTSKIDAGKLIYNVNEGPRVKIASVKFNGNRQLKTKALKKTVKTKKKTFFFWPKYYVQTKTDNDITKLQKAYHKKGFLNADISLKQTLSEDKSKINITFIIHEGARYKVESVSINGNKHYDNVRLQKELKLKSGDIYNQQRSDSDVKRLLKLYREIGFIDVKVEQAKNFVGSDQVELTLVINEGGRFRIGQINISGNQDTQDKVVRRVLDEYDFQPGKWYDAHIARGDATGSGYLEKLVRRTAYAESAVITPVGDAPGQRDAHVSVTEGQTGSVMLGAGVASDSGVIGQLIFEQRNFDISDKPESFKEFLTGQAFKGAGQNFRIALQPGTEVSEYSLSFTEPYFDNRPISLDVVGSSYERGRESYDEKRTKAYIGFEKRYKSKWRRSVSLRLENVNVGSIDTDAPKEIVDDKGDNLLTGIRLGLRRDKTDDRFNPTTGYTFSTGYEQLAGDHTFGILTGTYRNYKTIYEDLAERKTVLATKLHAGAIVGDAPPFEKFYAGGQGSIRGFDYRGVSTRGLQTGVTPAKRKDPIGSNWIFLANAEVTVPLISDNFSALFFVDSGTVDTGGYRASVGTGIQIMLPQWFGPVPMRFELAAPLLKDGDDQTQVFSFSIGRLF